MTTKLVALFILSSALAVSGRDPLPAATYALVLDQVSIPGRITGIVEGDTIKVRILAKPEIKVRIAFIDAPEKGQAFDQRAKQAMSELVFGKDVVLQPHTIDRSGRLVARVLVDGQDAGLELLKQGLCWVYEKNVGEASALVQARYRNAQDAAQAQKAGLWQDPDPMPPWNWRKEKDTTLRLQSINSSTGWCSMIPAW
jgi:endonuclease YncB( thermonuclease family)